MTRLNRTNVDRLILPDDVKVGDTFQIRGTVTITRVTYPAIDVTALGDPRRKFVADELECDIVIEADVLR